MNEISRNTLIALGSNENSVWGDAGETILKAMTEVCKLAVNSPKMSGLFTTPAFPAGAGPNFVNAAMSFSTALSAADLLAALHQIEADAGRQRTKRWGQRTLDLDLIAMDDLVCPDPETHQRWRDLPLDDQMQKTPQELILPHPRLQDRAFVLVPLMDVAAGWAHPLLNVSVAQMCAALPQDLRSEVVRQDDPPML